MSKPQTRPALPADAIGFVARRKDRPERLALFNRDGALSNTFAADETHADVAAILARNGLRLAADGVVFRDA